GDVRTRRVAPVAARAARMTAAPVDLRSDTVTRPSPGMRRAMAEAEVGDDVLDRDPTTRRLEQRVAELLGTDDALFFPSGTQANQTGVALLTHAGSELLLEADAHLVHYEQAGVAANWGVQIRPIATADGLLTGDRLRAALRPASRHCPRAGAGGWAGRCASRASSARRRCTRSITTWPGWGRTTRTRDGSPSCCPIARPCDRPVPRRTSSCSTSCGTATRRKRSSRGLPGRACW